VCRRAISSGCRGRWPFWRLPARRPSGSPEGPVLATPSSASRGAWASRGWPSSLCRSLTRAWIASSPMALAARDTAVLCAGVLGSVAAIAGSCSMGLAILVLLADLAAYGAVLDGTFSTTAAREWVEQERTWCLSPGAGGRRFRRRCRAVPRLHQGGNPARRVRAARVSLSQRCPGARRPKRQRVHASSTRHLLPTWMGYCRAAGSAQRALLPDPPTPAVDEASELYDVMNPFAARR
jgi:hypothetical protein